MTDTEQNPIKAPQHRSPAYPYIALDAALERAGKIYRQVHDMPQPREVIANAYGKPASSATLQTLATLSQYGLLENVNDNGVRKMRVTSVARELLHPHAPADKVAEARKSAALAPAIFSEMWERYGDSRKYGDGILLYYLTRDREREQGAAFTEKAAKEVLRIYRATMDYAGLSGGDKNSTQEPDEEVAPADNSILTKRMDEGVAEQGEGPAAGSKQRSIEMATGERELQTGILSKGASYRVIVSGKIGVREIERLIAKLELDKEILADADNDEETDGDKGVFG